MLEIEAFEIDEIEINVEFSYFSVEEIKVC